MKIYFNQPAFDGQLLRVISHTYTGCADIGECLSTASHITEGSFDSWHEEWVKTAERLFSMGQEAEENGHIESAMECYLRASNYFRVSTFFHYEAPVPPHVLFAFEKHTSAFQKAMFLCSKGYRSVNIPFEGTYLPGYFYQTDTQDEPRPVIIVNGGYDSTHQEGYFSFAPLALKRNYNVLAFDGPGQGALLFHQRLPMRYDWETVIRPVVDYLEELPEVDNDKIILYGPSWGGMLTPRATAFESRISALITNPGQWDALTNVNQALTPQIEEEPCDPVSVDDFLQVAFQDKFFARKFHSKMFVHGVESPVKLLEEWENYHLSEVVDKIKCPTLVCDSENEPYSTGQARKLYEALQCPKTFHLFTSSVGAGEHCCSGALGYLSQVIFDWLEETFDLAETNNTLQPH